jgi:hypothetical protein
MAMTNYEKSRFRFSETFNNSDGKTSGSAFIGVIMGLIAGLTWIAIPVLLIAFDVVSAEVAIEIMKQTINLVWASAALLGARKIAGTLINKPASAPGPVNTNQNAQQPG